MTHIREHLKNTTKAVIAGDWHGNYSWVKNKAVYMCQRFDTDTIIQLGDFGFIPGTSEFTKLDTLLGKKGVTVFFVDGNHEPFDTYRAPNCRRRVPTARHEYCPHHARYRF